jgi:hypothetical protein
MTTYSLPTPKLAVSRSNFLPIAAILASSILAMGYAGPASADPLFGLLSRHNSDGYARPLDARMAMEDCQKGKFASGVATLKRALERAQIPVPPVETADAQPPAPLKPHGEKRHQSQ